MTNDAPNNTPAPRIVLRGAGVVVSETQETWGKTLGRRRLVLAAAPYALRVSRDLTGRLVRTKAAGRLPSPPHF